MEITSKPEALDVIDRQVCGLGTVGCGIGCGTRVVWVAYLGDYLPPHNPPSQVLQMEMERLSLGKAAKNDRTAAARLATLDLELSNLKDQQAKITGQWDGERKEMMKVKVRGVCWGGASFRLGFRFGPSRGCVPRSSLSHAPLCRPPDAPLRQSVRRSSGSTSRWGKRRETTTSTGLQVRGEGQEGDPLH
jgi:hypothetical protein